MSYAAAIDQLNAMAPELYARPGQPRRKFSLDEFRTLLAALDNPHQRFRSVLIAGTNGKGSTAATLASILNATGARAGLYTSPHLQRVNERIRIDNSEISEDDFARFYFRVQDVAQQLVQQGRLPQHPSFFEILTALAFLYFAEAKIDLAVLEVGMGGRLDATNVVDPLLSIITDISLDHTEWLGSTIAAMVNVQDGTHRPAASSSSHGVSGVSQQSHASSACAPSSHAKKNGVPPNRPACVHNGFSASACARVMHGMVSAMVFVTHRTDEPSGAPYAVATHSPCMTSLYGLNGGMGGYGNSSRAPAATHPRNGRPENVAAVSLMRQYGAVCVTNGFQNARSLVGVNDATASDHADPSAEYCSAMATLAE